MDHRNETFRKKFGDAAKCFGMRPTDIVSLKIREIVTSYSEYHELLKLLESEFGVRWKPIDAELQGRGYLLTHHATQVIMVEHETGLEILYIAGSIASLVALVPLVLQGWQKIRRRVADRHHRGGRDIEIRRLDENGHLLEEHAHDALTMSGISSDGMTTIAKMIENDVRYSVIRMDSLTHRVENLEKRTTAKAEKSRRTTKSARKKHS